MTTIAQKFGLSSDYSNILQTETAVVGIECEIEDVYLNSFHIPSNWRVEEDGSLRNNGVEFISMPLTCQEASEAFRALHKTIKYRGNNDPFSERTSIHVHLNCFNMEPKQVRTLLLIYAIWEPIFFQMVHPRRMENIHCVPLFDTVIPQFYNKSLEVLIDKWGKYSAINLLPLKEYGTVEFRHMHGHNDPMLFDQWLHAIENLWKFSMKWDKLLPDHLCNDETLKFMGESLFVNLPVSWRQDIANSLIDVKLSMV